MELNEYIDNYCNPVVVDNLKNIVIIFNNYEYMDYLEDYNKIVEFSSDGETSTLGLSLSNMLFKHASLILKSIGIVVDENMLTADELDKILTAVNDLPNIISNDKDNVYRLLDISEDNEMFFIDLIVTFTNIPKTRLFSIIDSVSTRFVDSVILITNTVNNDSEGVNNDKIIKLVNIVRGLNIKNIDMSILGLKLINIESEDTLKLSEYLNVSTNFINGNDVYVDNVNIMSLLVISKDSMFDREKYYVEYIEELIDDEYYKQQLFKEFKLLDEHVISLYGKYGLIKEE